MDQSGSVKKTGVAALAGAIAVSAAATFLGETQEDQTSTYWIVAIFIAAATLLVFGLPVWRAMKAPAHKNTAAMSGLITSIAGLLTIVAYWSGLPVVLGAAGALLGRQGIERAKGGAGRKGMALAAFAIGLLAIFGALASTISDKLA